jgi:peptidoglycan/LPS O-acetylase OafA/YrhL
MLGFALVRFVWGGHLARPLLTLAAFNCGTSGVRNMKKQVILAAVAIIGTAVVGGFMAVIDHQVPWYYGASLGALAMAVLIVNTPTEEEWQKRPFWF